MVTPLSAETRLRLKKQGASTISPITPSIRVEDAYNDYLDGLTNTLAEDIEKEITPIFSEMVATQQEYDNYLSNLETINKGLLDAKINSTEDIYNNNIASQTLTLTSKVDEMKIKYAADVEAYTAAATLFVQSVNSYSQNELYKQISKKYSVSRVQFLSLEEVSVPFEAAVKENVSLITNVSQEYLDKVEKAVLDNFTSIANKQDTPSLIQAVLDEREGVTLSRAKLIARDQSAKVTEAFNTARYENYGITKGIWTVADFSQRTRPSHLKLNGKIFDLKKGARKDDGTYIVPSEEVRCRCTARPVIPEGLFD